MKKRTAMLLILTGMFGALVMNGCAGGSTRPAGSPSQSTLDEAPAADSSGSASGSPDASKPAESSQAAANAAGADSQKDPALVKTTAGTVQGAVANEIIHFFGIPYAQAEERFVPAVPVTPWEGVFDATAFGPISMQQSGMGGTAAYADGSGNASMDNNCQNLNIWTPETNGTDARPVMVWLHGGGFASGASSTDPGALGENLSKNGDVVVVSVNHRLNMLGHFDLSAYGDKYKDSANVGVSDLVDALQWIQDNIAQFGGDPGNVTIFGESGGGAKVLALMTTPRAKGLFHKGIVQSGTTDTVGMRFTAADASKRVTELTLKNLGVDADSIESLQSMAYEELMTQSASALQQAAEEFGIPGPFGGFAMEWEPVVDGEFMPSDPVTETSFAEAARDIPLLIGTNLAEWEAFSLMMNMSESQTSNKTTWDEEEVDTRLTEKYGVAASEIAEAFLKAYPYKTRADALYVDKMIRMPSLRIMSHKADQQGAPVYAYVFTWESPDAPGLILSNHTAEIPFVFHNIGPAARMAGDSEEAHRLEALMSEAWVRFARSGNPGTENLPEWPAYDRETGATMLFDNEPMLGMHHDRELMRLLAPDYEY